MAETWWQRVKREEAATDAARSLRDNWTRWQSEAESLPFGEQNNRYQELGRMLLGESYDATKYNWMASNPIPDKSPCSCYEWRRYPIGQRHFGFALWCACELHTCECKCHAEQVWMAS